MANMMRGMLGVAVLGAVLFSSGCAYNAVVGHSSAKSGAYFGDFGVKGNGNTATIESGSKIRNLSIWGDNNRVIVEDEVTVAKLEVYGKNNTVSLPYYLDIRMTETTGGNTIERRPRGSFLSSNRTLGPDYQLPPRYQGAAPSPVPVYTYPAGDPGPSYFVPQPSAAPASPSGAVNMAEQNRPAPAPEPSPLPPPGSPPSGGIQNVTPVDLNERP
jgi:hypothetical protein